MSYWHFLVTGYQVSFLIIPISPTLWVYGLASYGLVVWMFIFIYPFNKLLLSAFSNCSSLVRSDWVLYVLSLYKWTPYFLYPLHFLLLLEAISHDCKFRSLILVPFLLFKKIYFPSPYVFLPMSNKRLYIS